jgi:hypothetical protein
LFRKPGVNPEHPAQKGYPNPGFQQPRGQTLKGRNWSQPLAGEDSNGRLQMAGGLPGKLRPKEEGSVAPAAKENRQEKDGQIVELTLGRSQQDNLPTDTGRLLGEQGIKAAGSHLAGEMLLLDGGLIAVPEVTHLPQAGPENLLQHRLYVVKGQRPRDYGVSTLLIIG